MREEHSRQMEQLVGKVSRKEKQVLNHVYLNGHASAFEFILREVGNCCRDGAEK